MFENLIKFLKNAVKKEKKKENINSKDAAKERLHLVLMQDRANVSADFLELMKQEIIEVIKKYIEVDEKEIDVRLTSKENEDGTNGAPALYANIPILNIKNEARKVVKKEKVVNNENENENQSETIEEQNKEENVEQEKNIIQDEEKQQDEVETKEELVEINAESDNEVVETLEVEQEEKQIEENIEVQNEETDIIVEENTETQNEQENEKEEQTV